MSNNNDSNEKQLPPFWLDQAGQDRTAEFNFYRFCQTIEALSGKRLGTGRTPESDPVRFRPNPHLGFPAGELKRTETNPDNPDLPPNIITNFFGLYGVDSPLPTAYIDDINQGREGADAMAAFLDIFNHRFMTQFFRIWRKYNYPASFEAGGTDRTSQSLMALTGITNPGSEPASRMLAILQPLVLTTHTADGVKAVIRSQAPHTTVKVIPHLPVMMPVDNRARLSIDGGITLGERPILGDEVADANYCMKVEMYTEDKKEAKGWMPDGQLRKDVFAMLKVYLGCDYDASLHLMLPTRLLPPPRLGDPGLFIGYNVMLGLREDNLDEMPDMFTMKVGKLRNGKFDD